MLLAKRIRSNNGGFLRLLAVLGTTILIIFPSLTTLKEVSASTITPPSDFKIISGVYTGNGTSQSITGLGFQPKVVIVKGDTAGINAVWRSDAMVGDTTATMALAANITGGVTSLDADGFSVGSNATVNTAAVVYYYIAFGGVGGDIATGSYTGDGTDDRSISGVGFQPAFVWIKGNLGGQSGHWRSLVHSGDSSSYLADDEDGANFIQAFETDGFQIGNDNSVNQNLTTYYYVAFKDVPTQMQTGSYTGDGTDDRSISVQSGFKPDYVWVKAASGFSPATRNLKHTSYAVPTGENLTIFVNANELNHIQALEANGFQIGTDNTVNQSSVVFNWVAWRHLPNVPAALGPAALTNGSTGTDNTPTLQFSLSDPMVGETVRYQVQIDDTSDFSSPVVDYTAALASQGAASFTVGQDPGSGSYTTGSSGQTLALGSYYWRVLTIDQYTAPSSYTVANSGSVAFVLAASTVSLPNTGPDTIAWLFNLFPVLVLSNGLLLRSFNERLYQSFILGLLKKELVAKIRNELEMRRQRK